MTAPPRIDTSHVSRGQGPVTKRGFGDIARSKGGDPLDVDGDYYNADLHLNKLLNEKQLIDLIQRDNELVAEIKQLDGDMKTLVYENYNKFISAADTIRRMKANVESMEVEMEQLSNRMNTINHSAGDINNALEGQRNKLHQLYGADILLKKLNFVLELPTRLNECVEKGQYAQAVQYYTRVSSLLERYHHMSVFEKIEEECRVIIEGLTRRIKLKLHDEMSTMGEIRISVGLLIALDAGFPMDLAREHLRAGSLKLELLKQSAFKQMQNSKLDASTEAAVDGLPPDVRLVLEQIMYFDRTFLREFADFVDTYDKFFLQHDNLPMSSSDLKYNLAGKLLPEQQVEVKARLVALVDTLTKEYIEVIERLLSIPEDISKLSPLAYIHVLDRVHQDAQELESLRRIGRLDKRINAVSYELLSKVITAVFARIKHGFFRRYGEFKQTDSADLIKFVKELNTWIRNTLINEHLPILERFVSPDIDFLRHTIFSTDDILDQIQRGLDVFWLSFTEEMMQLCNPPHSLGTAPPPTSILMMSRSAFELSVGTVEGVMSAYTDVLFARKGAHNVGGDGALMASTPRQRSSGNFTVRVSGTSQETMDRAREISSICRTTAQRLLTIFTHHTGRSLSALVHRSVHSASWVTHPDPTGPSQLSKTILNKFTELEADVGILYGDESLAGGGSGSVGRAAGRSAEYARLKPGSSAGSRRHSRTNSSVSVGGPSSFLAPSSQSTYLSPLSSAGSASSPRRSESRYDPLLSKIDRLFAERVEYFVDVGLGRGSALEALVKIVLKAYIETVRLITMNSAGLKQIQYDMEALKNGMWRWCADDSALRHLLEEIINSAQRRCIG
ncbi:hypothetical protein BC832DRAFT_594284 [Gaertneriomyces semiglobifer]|nr:hypothetical protein BC832DRAFT_594284 [Gaertneriomyces semiglobifer]